MTLEHEWILVFRKGGKRQFKAETEKVKRRTSAFFWEERNIWFSDIWDFKGTQQKIKQSKSRSRSAAFPLELPYRIINMYSLQDDTVLDPFLGTGTIMLAAIAANRNSIGYEIDRSFHEMILDNITSVSKEDLNAITKQRVDRHRAFIDERLEDSKKSPPKYLNSYLKVPVIAKQEKEIQFKLINDIQQVDGNIQASYEDYLSGKE